MCFYYVACNGDCNCANLIVVCVYIYIYLVQTQESMAVAKVTPTVMKIQINNYMSAKIILIFISSQGSKNAYSMKTRIRKTNKNKIKNS